MKKNTIITKLNKYTRISPGYILGQRNKYITNGVKSYIY
jgi:hypothetical protein